MSHPNSEKSSTRLTDDLIKAITKSLEEGEEIRVDLGGLARLNIERPLPFLCIYRIPEDRKDRGTANLIMGEASYLIANRVEGLSELVEAVSKTIADKFGAVLIIEIWSAKPVKTASFYTTDSKVRFKVFVEGQEEIPSTVETLGESLISLDLPYFRIESNTITVDDDWPKGRKPLLGKKAIRKLGCLMIGLEVTPIYQNAETDELHVSTLRLFRRELSKALKDTFFEFVHVQTPDRPTHPQILGRQLVVDAAWSADEELSALSDQFNYLMAVTPVNASQAYKDFKKTGYSDDPVFHYRLLTIDPEDLKRKLYSISFDKIEDPTMAYLLRDKRIELDRQITLIEDRNTPSFLYESLQLFPPVEDELMNLALEILAKSEMPYEKRNKLNASEVADLANKEIRYYSRDYPEMTAKVEIREDTPPGLMVSHGNLLIGHKTGITGDRINALIQHEIGTHSITYFNGKAQPLKLLYSGLPGYEQLQEGIAVTAEYLVGGLTLGRLRTLAARVVGVRRLTQGRSFCEVFHELSGEFSFSKRTAFNIAMRIFRGGGLTKDAVYLRGLVEVLEYLGKGGAIETLFVGKMGSEHVSIIRELQWREVLRPVPLTPRYMTFPETAGRLKNLREGMSVIDLV